MTKGIFTALVISLFLSGSFPARPAAEVSVVAGAEACSPSSERKILVTLVDKEGRSVGDLRSEDLSISENKSSREILKLENAKDEPLAVAILIDTSASQKRTLDGTKLVAQKFVESFLRSTRARAALVSFAETAIIEQDLTSNFDRLQAAISRVRYVHPLFGGVITSPPRGKQMLSGTSAIWDAVWATVDGITPAAGERRLIVLLTDGEDTSSRTALREAIERAAVNQFAVFPIGIADKEQYYQVASDKLRKLADGTGGRAFFPQKIAELDRVFLELGQMFQSQYLLNYCSANSKSPGKPLKIEIEVKNAQLRQSKLKLSYSHYAL